MRYRKLDANGDSVFGGGQADFYHDEVEAVAQAVRTRLLLWLGEWFLDTDEGTPYLQGIIGKHDEVTMNAVLRGRILDTEGVTSIESFESNINPDTRKLSVSVTIDTIYGTTQIQVAA